MAAGISSGVIREISNDILLMGEGFTAMGNVDLIHVWSNDITELVMIQYM